MSDHPDWPRSQTGTRVILAGISKLVGRWRRNLGLWGHRHNPSFSPSTYHRRLAASLVPSLSYRGGDLEAWRAELTPVLRRLLGELSPPLASLRVRSLWTRTVSGGTVEKIVFESQPEVEVPAYLCLPSQVRPPYPVMICLQGHSSGMHTSISVDRFTESRPIRVQGDRDLALGCLSRGVAALCIEQRALGERSERVNPWPQVTWHECTEAAMHALVLGQTLIGQRVYDVDRGIDFLQMRGGFDLTRLGVMGQSCGGTISLYSAALLSRIKIAVVCSAFCTYQDSLLPRLHCPDNYVPSILRYCEISDVLGLCAPRPVIVVGGRRDPIFPFVGFQRAASHLRAIYEAAHAAGNCRVVEVGGGHRFYAREIWAELGRYLEAPA
jgi:dienelactone hydrolase